MTAGSRPQTGLGRGLAALIPTRAEMPGTIELPIAAISRNPYQPRRAMDREALAGLAASIAEHGVLQPVLVSQTTGGYRLIAGERRLRAAEMAGLERIPALVRSVDDDQQLAFALVENLQRADLNPLEEARAFDQLINEFGLTQEQVAQRMGRSRSAIANTLRLIQLAPAVQEAVLAGELSEGHARALGGLAAPAEQEAALRVITARGLSVRQAEELVRRAGDGGRRRAGGTGGGTGEGTAADSTTELEGIERGLRAALGTKVSVAPRARGGRITIDYYSDDDLARLYDRLVGGA